jgi:hypothetical protein
MSWLSCLSDIATILTAITAAGASVFYLYDRYSKRLRLEEYLREVKAAAPSKSERGRRTLIHLMASCGMTESEVLDAAFRSKKIKRPVWLDKETGYASGILLEYDEEIE